MKAKQSSEVKKFTDIPNIGKSMEGDFILIGIKTPGQLKGKDAYRLFKKLCATTTSRAHTDPCVLDTFIAAVDFMNGAPARPWWHYTEERKRVWKR